MIQALCIKKFRNANNQITGYKLVDTEGTIKDIKPEVIKTAIKQGKMVVYNLNLTSDNRLIDAPEPAPQKVVQANNTVFVTNKISEPTGAQAGFNAALQQFKSNTLNYSDQVLTCVQSLSKVNAFSRLKKMYAAAYDLEKVRGCRTVFSYGHMSIQRFADSFPGGAVDYCSQDTSFSPESAENRWNNYSLVLGWSKLQDYKAPSGMKGSHSSSAWVCARFINDELFVEYYLYCMPKGWGNNYFLVRLHRFSVKEALCGQPVDVFYNNIRLVPDYFRTWVIRENDLTKLTNFDNFETNFYDSCKKLVTAGA